MKLLPSTGTNPYYARRHGYETRNTVDKVTSALSADYQPTGAKNSLDALAMLCNDEHIEFAEFARKPKIDCPPQLSTGQLHALAVKDNKPYQPPSLQGPPEAVLVADYGWSEQDARRQLQALKSCPGDSTDIRISKAFDLSSKLEHRSTNKLFLATALTVTSIATGLSAVATAFSNPTLALSLVGTAAAAIGGSQLVMNSYHQDFNNRQILDDAAMRVVTKACGFNQKRQPGHGDYPADFSLYTHLLP